MEGCFVRRSLIALPLALLLSVLVAGTAFATHCGVENKPDGAGQLTTILVNVATNEVTVLEGGNKAGRFTGGFVDVYLDFDFSGTISSGDGHINDTLLVSEHSLNNAPGQDEGGLAVLPPILRGVDPAGAGKGAGFAAFSIVP
jgi:hypothetical protein